MAFVKNIAATARKLAGFIKWAAWPETLIEPEAEGKEGPGRSFWRWLLLPEALAPATDPAAAPPGRGRLRAIFETETLGRAESADKGVRRSAPARLFSWEALPHDEPPAEGGARPGFLKNLLAFESLPRDEKDAPRPPSLLRWLARREKLGAEKGAAREGQSTNGKEG